MDNPRETQALDRPKQTTVIATTEEFDRRYQKWANERANILVPMRQFGELPESHVLMPTLVQLDPSPDAGDVYQDGVFTRKDKGEYAIAKTGLSKIAQAAGITITTERTDDRRLPNYWEVRATATWRSLDGTNVSVQATEEFDLRNGSPRADQMKGNQLLQARIKGLRQCEARAINAAIRQYGVKQKYTREELGRPFVVLRVVYQPDMTDPDIKKMVAERALGGASTLYPPRALPAAEPQHLDTIGAGAAPTATPPPQVRVTTVEQDLEAGLYTVTFDDGLALTTSDHELARQSNRACKDGAPVTITVDDADPTRLTGLALHGTDRAADARPANQSASQGGALPDGQHHVAHVKALKRGQNANGPWTLYEVASATTGEAWRTFSATHAKDAEHAKEKGWPVRIVDKANEKYPDQKDIESLTVIDPRQGSLPMDEQPRGGY